MIVANFRMVGWMLGTALAFMVCFAGLAVILTWAWFRDTFLGSIKWFRRKRYFVRTSGITGLWK